MRQFWFKIYSPLHNETRIFWLNPPGGNDIEIFNQLKNDVRHVFNWENDFEFYFSHIDKDNDEITIKHNYELLNYLIRMEHTDRIKLSIVPISSEKIEEKRSMKSTDTEDSNSSVALSESFQSIMKHLELGMSNLQASVEKSAKTVATSTVDTVVKTAAETAASVYRSMLPLTTNPSSSSEVPQFDVICDGCYTPIRGQRWRCETCDDFDLCSTCKSRVNHNQTHNFRFIKKESPNYYVHEEKNNMSEEIETSSYESNPSQTIFICDYCDSDIVGIRHTCGACPDFDLCHSCFSIVKENHPEHIFVTRLVGAQAFKPKNKQKKRKSKPTISPRKSYDQETSTVHHIGVQCDNCQKDITGIRFKCGHCINYDLCETCEEEALSFHDIHHAFIKIRYPIQSISRKAILPRFIPLGEKPFEDTKSSASSININKIEDEKIAINTERSVPSNSSSTIPPLENNLPAAPPVITATLSETLPATEPVNEPKLAATFVSDINIPDGTSIVPKKTFIKMWKILNNGNIDWPAGTHLLFTGGSILRPHPMSRPDSFVVPVISPNEETCITAELRAPDCAGEYSSYFCLCTPDGIRFGDTLWCSIKVDHDDDIEQMTKSVSEQDMLMNSSNSMIYPTLSTESSYHELPLETESNGDYTDHDQYSESTNDHIYQHSESTNDHHSIITSNLSYTNSHVSSPAASELDIGERRSDNFFTEVIGAEENNEQVNNANYQVISPAASIISATSVVSAASVVSVTSAASTAIVVSPTDANINVSERDSNDSDDEFIMIDKQEDTTAEENPHSNSGNNSNNNSLSSSSHTIIPSKEIIPDEVIYRSQLLKLNEMGFTNCDDLAVSLLKSHQGRVEDVIAKLLLYP